MYVSLLRWLRNGLRTLGVLKLLDRAAFRSRTAHWVRSWFAIYDLEDMVGLGVPWWTYAAINVVEKHLAARPGARVFEWGSGASTMWLAARAQSVVAVEHDADWAASMSQYLPANARVAVVEPTATQRPTTPSAKRGFSGLDFTAYVATVDRYDGPFDLVVVDGRAREACLDRALEHLAPGGLVVFDNVDRRRYRDEITRHDDLEVLWTRGRTPSLPYPPRTALLRRRVTAE